MLCSDSVTLLAADASNGTARQRDDSPAAPSCASIGYSGVTPSRIAPTGIGNHWPPQDHAIKRHQSPTRRPAIGQYIRQPDIANRGLSVSQSVSRPPVTSLQVLYLYPLFCRSSSTNTTSCNFKSTRLHSFDLHLSNL